MKAGISWRLNGGGNRQSRVVLAATSILRSARLNLAFISVD
jgi:hypothetical protein